jgi:alkylation response protein AidB-like acyl-CoA dehydrogenase
MTATNAERVITGEHLVKRARKLIPVLQERAVQTEEERRVLPESVRALLDEQLNRIAVPIRYGGLDVSYEYMLEVTIELGRGCGATSWCYSLWSAHAWLVGHWPEEAQLEVFGDSPDALCSSSFGPGGAKAVVVPGGFRLSGRWEFSSGCDSADWLMLGAAGDAGPNWLLVPRGDFTIDDTWFVSGLAGTGSKDIVIEDLFVPQHRVLSGIFRQGPTIPEAAKLHSEPQYRLPITALLVWDLVAPAIGMAYGAIDSFTERLQGTSGRMRSAESQIVQTRLAEASAEADAARALLRQDVREMLAQAEDGTPFTPLQLARYQRDKAFVVKLCVQAVSRLFELAGGHALFHSDPLQRIHRDVVAVGHRDGLVLDFAGQQYGRAALGLEPLPMGR